MLNKYFQSVLVNKDAVLGLPDMSSTIHSELTLFILHFPINDVFKVIFITYTIPYFEIG